MDPSRWCKTHIKGKKVVEGRRNTALVKFNVKGTLGRSRFLILENTDKEINCNNGVGGNEESNYEGHMEVSKHISYNGNGKSQMEKEGINDTTGVHEEENVEINNSKVKNYENDTRKWLDMIGECNKKVGLEKTTVTVVSGGRRQHQESRKKKTNNLTTCGGIKIK